MKYTICYYSMFSRITINILFIGGDLSINLSGSYYSGSVLKMAGFPVKYAIWLVTIPNLINFLSSFIGIYLVEKIGRRQLLIFSLAGVDIADTSYCFLLFRMCVCVCREGTIHP